MPKLNSYYFKITSVFYMLWVFAFVFTGMYANRLDSLNLTSLIDKEIPLIPEFVWFYLLCFIFAGCAKERTTLSRRVSPEKFLMVMPRSII